MGNQSSYSVRLITNWLDDDQRKITHYFSSPRLDSHTLTQTGLCIHLNKHIRMSVQTDPRISGEAFAETALQANGGIIYCEELGYSDVIRHDDPTELFDHIAKIMAKIKENGETFGVDIFPEKKQRNRDFDAEKTEEEKDDTDEKTKEEEKIDGNDNVLCEKQ